MGRIYQSCVIPRQNKLRLGSLRMLQIYHNWLMLYYTFSAFLGMSDFLYPLVVGLLCTKILPQFWDTFQAALPYC